MGRTILFFLWITLFAVCKSYILEFQPEKPIEVNLKNVPVIEPDTKSSSLIENLKYIPLETNGNIVFNDINSILYANKKYYILDHKLNTIFIFNSDGKYINRISKTGRGPGEYVGIYSFDLDESQNIYVYDNASNKILKYRNEGKAFEEFKLKTRFEEFKVLNDNELLVRNLYDKGIIISHLSKYDYKTNKTVNLIGKDEYPDNFDIPRFGFSYLFESDNIICFNPRFTNSIYRIENGKLMKYISINSSFPTSEFIDKLKKDRQITYAQDKYITDIRDIYENSTTITIKIHKQWLYNLLISKKTGKQILSHNIIDENYFGNSIIYGIAGEEFISKLEPHFYLNKKWIDMVNKSRLDQESKNILLRINENSNPVLILIKFKEF